MAVKASGAFSADARRRRPSRRRKRSTRPACEQQPARPSADLAKPGVQPGAESASGGLGVPVAFLSNRHEQARSEGENACTREQRSEGPVTGRSGDTTDHAAKRNAGSGHARSVTPSAARSVPDADGVERSGDGYDIANHATTGTRTASRASGERRTRENHDAERSTLHGSTATTTDGQALCKRAATRRGVVRPPPDGDG